MIGDDSFSENEILLVHVKTPAVEHHYLCTNFGKVLSQD